MHNQVAAREKRWRTLPPLAEQLAPDPAEELVQDGRLIDVISQCKSGSNSICNRSVVRSYDVQLNARDDCLQLLWVSEDVSRDLCDLKIRDFRGGRFQGAY